MGELLNACIMFFAPLIVNRIGGKNALLLAGTIMSVLAGNMYESIGFHGAYLVLGLIALGFTVISLFTLSGQGPLTLLRRQANEAV